MRKNNRPCWPEANVAYNNRLFTVRRPQPEIKLACRGEIEKSLKPRQRARECRQEGRHAEKRARGRERRRVRGRVKTQRAAKTRLKMKGRLTTYFR